jgi:hypothetical protein
VTNAALLERTAALPPAAQPRPGYAGTALALRNARDLHRIAVQVHRAGDITDDELDALTVRLGEVLCRFESERQLHHESRCEAPHEGERCGTCHGCEHHAAALLWREPVMPWEPMRAALAFAACDYSLDQYLQRSIR